MTALKEIMAIEKELFDCFDKDLPIDPRKVKRQQELVRSRLTELVATHSQRMEIMQAETRKLTAQLVGLDLDLKPDIKEKLYSELDKYDKAASRWVASETCLWIESEASSIAAGIMILANEVR